VEAFLAAWALRSALVAIAAAVLLSRALAPATAQCLAQVRNSESVAGPDQAIAAAAS
jgi:hypothetical protein